MSRLSDHAHDLAAGAEPDWLVIGVLVAAGNVVEDLLRMDREGAIALEYWPAAQHLLRLARRSTLITNQAGGVL